MTVNLTTADPTTAQPPVIGGFERSLTIIHMDFLLKSGIFGLAIILAFFALLVAGIIAIAITRSRRVAAIFGLLAFFPLILGLCGTILGNLKVNDFVREHKHEMSPEALNQVLNHPQSVVAAGRREAGIPVYMGAAATAVLLVVAGCGGALAKKPKPR